MALKLKLDFYTEQCQGHALAVADMFRRWYGSDLFHSLLPAIRGSELYLKHMEQSLLHNEMAVITDVDLEAFVKSETFCSPVTCLDLTKHPFSSSMLRFSGSPFESWKTSG